jgi:hypothetical protein
VLFDRGPDGGGGADGIVITKNMGRRGVDADDAPLEQLGMPGAFGRPANNIDW